MSILNPTPVAPVPQGLTTEAVPSAMASRSCLTCGAPRTGPFCAGCGQPEVGRLTLRGIGTRLVADAMDLNRGLLFTFVELWRRPGELVRDYVHGRTVRYTNPIKYFLIVAAVTTLVYVRSGVAAETAAGLAEEMARSPVEGLQVEAGTVLQFISSYFTLILLAGLPTSALATRLVLRRLRFNYAEHLVLNTFVAAQQCFLLVTGLILASVVGAGTAGLGYTAALVAASVAYLGHAVRGVSGSGWLRSLTDAVLAAALSLLLFNLLSALVGVIVGAGLALAGR